MRLIERLGLETEEYHPKADEDALQLLGPATPADYRRFLMRTFSFVAPVERSIANVRGLDRVIDVRRFTKAEMIRRDLLAFRIPSDEIDRISLCSVPMFDSLEEALGWVYPIERSTLGHSNLF